MEKNVKFNAENLKLSDFENKELDVKITKIFNMFGVSQKYFGFNYLRLAAKMCVMREELQQQVVKGIYPVIAEEYETTPSAVERGIRHYISVLYENVDTELLCAYIPCACNREGKPPTNADVIATLADNLRMGVYDDML